MSRRRFLLHRLAWLLLRAERRELTAKPGKARAEYAKKTKIARDAWIAAGCPVTG